MKRGRPPGNRTSVEFGRACIAVIGVEAKWHRLAIPWLCGKLHEHTACHAVRVLVKKNASANIGFGLVIICSPPLYLPRAAHSYSGSEAQAD